VFGVVDEFPMEGMVEFETPAIKCICHVLTLVYLRKSKEPNLAAA
jgi:hypothetical protein